MDTVKFAEDGNGNIAVSLSEGAQKWLDGLRQRTRRITTRQPIEVRREYIEPNYEPHPLYTATRIYIAEIWLGMQK